MAQRKAGAAQSAPAVSATVIGSADAVMVNDPSSWDLFTLGGKVGSAFSAVKNVQDGVNALLPFIRAEVERQYGEGAKIKTYGAQRKLEGWSDESQRFGAPGLMAGIRAGWTDIAEKSFEVYWPKIRDAINDPEGQFVFHSTESRKRDKENGKGGEVSLDIGKAGGITLRCSKDADWPALRSALGRLNAPVLDAEAALFAKNFPRLFAILKDIAIGDLK